MAIPPKISTNPGTATTVTTGGKRPKRKKTSKTTSGQTVKPVPGKPKIPGSRQPPETKPDTLSSASITACISSPDKTKHYQVPITRAHKLLTRARLDNKEVEACIINLIKARLEPGELSGNLSATPLKVFLQELVNILIELDNRGISLGHPAQKDLKFSDNLKAAQELARDYRKIHQIDDRFQKLLDSGQCQTWDPERPMYRGGEYYFESKISRNMLKSKLLYNPGSININKELYGSGLYTGATPDVAKDYGSRQKNNSSGFLRIRLKANTPLIDYQNKEIQSRLRNSLRLTKKELKNYLLKLCKHPVVLRHDRGMLAPYFTIKSPAIIEQIEVFDDINSWHTASINRVNLETNTIKGEPTQFKEVIIPDDAEITGMVDAQVIGSNLCANAKVFTFKNKDNDPQYVIKSPINDNTYWSVAPVPHCHSLFTIEPHPDFLRIRHAEKLEKLTLDGWSDSRPAINQLWSAFQQTGLKRPGI